MGDFSDINESLGNYIQLVAELGVAMLCVMASQSHADRGVTRRASSVFWRLMAIVLLLVCGNDLLHGETLWLESARDAAKVYGVYESRRVVQFLVLMGSGALMLFVLRRIHRLLQNVHDKALCDRALKGMVLVLIMLGLNFVSFHYTDELIDGDIAGLSLWQWLEGWGLAMIGHAAIQTMLRSEWAGDHDV